MNSKNFRIKQVRTMFCKGNNVEFAEKLNKNTNVTSNWVREGYNIGRGVASEIASIFPVNIEWLLTGEGNMLKSDDTSIEGDNNSVMNINAGGDVKGNKLNPPTNVEMFMAEIAAQRKLTEKAQEQVSTSQEQMGILLELLKKQ